MSDFDYGQSGLQPGPDRTGAKAYLGWGVLLLACSLTATLIATEMAKSDFVNLANVLNGKSNSSLWPILLVHLANMCLYLGIGIVLLAVMFDLLHRYRESGK